MSNSQYIINNVQQACKSGNLTHLRCLIEASQVTVEELRLGLWPAIQYNQPEVVRYLLELGVDKVDGYVVEIALKASAIQVLEVLKKFGWKNINMSIQDIGTFKNGEAITALL